MKQRRIHYPTPPDKFSGDHSPAALARRRQQLARSLTPGKPAPRRTYMVIFAVLIAGGLLVLGIIRLAPLLASQNAAPEPNNSTTTGTQPRTSGAIAQESPPFNPLTPAGKQPQWSKLTPPNSAATYVYVDTLGGAAIQVSEQPLPESFQTNAADELARLASSYGANQKISVGSAAAYLGTSTKGQQSLLFMNDTLLVLIKSSAVLSEHQWQTYLSSLQ